MYSLSHVYGYKTGLNHRINVRLHCPQITSTTGLDPYYRRCAIELIKIKKQKYPNTKHYKFREWSSEGMDDKGFYVEKSLIIKNQKTKFTETIMLDMENEK